MLHWAMRDPSRRHSAALCIGLLFMTLVRPCGYTGIVLREAVEF
jgi:hypothetical protein